MRFKEINKNLRDCLAHETAELFIVEGASAALAVSHVRDIQTQAIYAMQGKPMNTRKVSKKRLLGNDWFSQLIDVLGTGIEENCFVSQCRYQKIHILMEPDADGMHASLLLMVFFYRWMPKLLADNRIVLIRPPIGEVVDQVNKTTAYLRTEQAFKEVLSQTGEGHIACHHYRGLAGIPPAILLEQCVHPQTRESQSLNLTNVESVLNGLKC